jgi:hypothetical protein
MAMGLDSLGRGSRVQAGRAGVLHLIGAVAGGGLVGAGVGWAGSLVWLDEIRLWVVGGSAALALLLTVRKRFARLGRSCQVPRHWARRMPAERVYLLWGLLLGAGIATVIPYPAYLIVLTIQATSGPAIGCLSGAAFGLAREAPAFIPMAFPGRSRDPGESMGLLPRLAPAAHRLNVAIILTAAALAALALVR